MGVLLSVLGFLGDGIKGFFGYKQAQIDQVSNAVNQVSNVISASETSAATREQAIAAVISSEASSDSWLTRTWRPLIIVIFSGFLVAYFLGYAPANLMHAIPENAPLNRLFDIIEMAIGGYMGGRSLEKIIKSIVQAGATKMIIQDLLNKKED